ncbi:BTB/POZ domain-containing protein 3-like [Eurosta solidaginis]|uniref:BTB/POZ domain-containing protein 3-like n=1 Tax=Eurosta solidaginis TaxID=178769 RepID=UPI003530D259
MIMENWDSLSYSEKLSYLKTSRADCSFVIGKGRNSKVIKAHKSVLARGSTVFESMFSGNYKEADESFNIPLENVLDFIDFKAVLECIYFKKTDSIESLNLKRLKHVAYLADYYMLDELLNACHIKMEKTITEKHTSFDDFLQCFEYQNKLGRRFTSYVNNGSTYTWASIEQKFPYASNELLTNTSVYDLDPLYFYELLKVFACKFKETERFCLIENYTKIHRQKIKEFKLTTSQIDDSNETNVENADPGKTLKEMFNLINFKQMTLAEFKLGAAVSEVWNTTAEEKFELLLAISMKYSSSCQVTCGYCCSPI